jgi:hypothetical protein
MSYQPEYNYEVYHEVKHKARTEHKCNACGEKISIGHRYTSLTIIWDGNVRCYKRCLRCQALHVHLRQKDPEMWPDELLSCGKDYRGEWGEDPPAEVEMLAFISQEESQRLIG